MLRNNDLKTYRASVSVGSLGTITDRWHKILALESSSDTGVNTCKILLASGQSLEDSSK